jgi:ParB-like chromosome segregation protein Spo0J
MSSDKDVATVLAAIRATVESAEDKLEVIEAIREELHKLSPQAGQPIDRVRWVPAEQVEPNNYNPNSVARKEMGLLYVSINQDGFTQPIVTIWDPQKQKYVIVDGFHRYFVGSTQADIRQRLNGYLPVVVIDKPINDRMASTVRHNRARGEHSIGGMGRLVFEMLHNGWDDAEICNHLGLEPEELLKLKHITGFSALFKNAEYSKAWETKNMIRKRLEYQRAEGQK